MGRVSDIRRSITFQADSVEKIRQAFEEAVDFYLSDCAERNEEPEKPATAREVVRVSPEYISLYQSQMSGFQLLNEHEPSS